MTTSLPEGALLGPVKRKVVTKGSRGRDSLPQHASQHPARLRERGWAESTGGPTLHLDHDARGVRDCYVIMNEGKATTVGFAQLAPLCPATNKGAARLIMVPLCLTRRHQRFQPSKIG